MKERVLFSQKHISAYARICQYKKVKYLKLCVNLSDEEIAFIKEICLTDDIVGYLEKYLRSNLLQGVAGSNTVVSELNEISEKQKDEFDDLIEFMEFAEISQNYIAEYTQKSQPTVSRFLKSKLKNSSLYRIIFKNLDAFLFNMFFYKVKNEYDLWGRAIREFEFPQLEFNTDKTNLSEENLILILKAIFNDVGTTLQFNLKIDIYNSNVEKIINDIVSKFSDKDFETRNIQVIVKNIKYFADLLISKRLD